MSESLKMTFITMADSIGIAMHNAVTAQRSGQTIRGATTNVTCTMIISKGK